MQKTNQFVLTMRAGRLSQSGGMKKKTMPDWTRNELRLLGKLPDTEVVKRTGRTTGAVAARRTLLGRPKPDSRYRSWTAREDALLPRLSSREIARRTGRSLYSVWHRRGRLGSPDPVR